MRWRSRPRVQRHHVVLLLMVVALFYALATGATLYYRIIYLLGLAFLGSYAWSRLNSRGIRIEIERERSHVQVGDTIEERIRVLNMGPIPKTWLEVQELTTMPGGASGQVISLQGGGQRFWRVRIPARQRGVYTLGPIRVTARDPFGLFHQSKTFPGTQEVVVYPAPVDLPNLSIAARAAGFNPRGSATSGSTPRPLTAADLTLEDRWILSRLSRVADEMTQLLGRYQFDAATRVLRDFTWSEFCDWYLEMIKPRLRDQQEKPTAQRVLVGVLDALLRLLHPFTPFITEELWQRLNEIAPERGLFHPEAAAASVMIAPWPELPGDWQDQSLESRVERFQETIVKVRNKRAEYRIPPGTALELSLRCDANTAGEMQQVSRQFENLAKTTLVAAGPNVERPPAAVGFTLVGGEGFIPLEGVIDRDAELDRQQQEAEKLSGFISSHEQK
ncbi:MAG: class I tRNA ligase family protein, partial [Chloroflexi bacterium]|nr:class I tRNA ligase family protein [Chloroflexota bacterium]